LNTTPHEALDLSLVIPVYNEEDNLAALAAEIRAALDPTGLDYEVLFIDDGSRDGKRRNMLSCRLIRQPLTTS